MCMFLVSNKNIKEQNMRITQLACTHTHITYNEFYMIGIQVYNVGDSILKQL